MQQGSKFLIWQTWGQLWRSAGLRSNQTYSQITLSDVNCRKPQLRIAKPSLVLGISYRNPTTNKCFYKIQGGGGLGGLRLFSGLESATLGPWHIYFYYLVSIWIYEYIITIWDNIEYYMYLYYICTCGSFLLVCLLLVFINIWDVVDTDMIICKWVLLY